MFDVAREETKQQQRITPNPCQETTKQMMYAWQIATQSLTKKGIIGK